MWPPTGNLMLKKSKRYLRQIKDFQLLKRLKDRRRSTSDEGVD